MEPDQIDMMDAPELREELRRVICELDEAKPAANEVGDQRLILPCPFCGEQPQFTEHFREKGLWNMIHRCKVIGAISWVWSDYERQVARWNTRQNAESCDPQGSQQ